VEPAEFIQRVKSSLRAHAAEVRVKELQAEFSSRLLHDLRGPVVTLSSSIDFLLKESAGPITPDQRQVFQDMRLNAVKLDALLNDMIDLTLFEFGKVNIEKLPVNLDVLVPAVCDRIRPRAAARQIRLNVSIGLGIPTLALDPEKMEQVLNNILDNAIKYTAERGSISVAVTAGNHVHAGSSGESVAIAISDTGIGIAKEELPLLFDKYKDLVTGKPSSLKTTGLGLAICKSIVEAHNGTMTAESEPDKGTTITMYFHTENV
jgi:two-component system sensor histidine kinase ResE